MHYINENIRFYREYKRFTQQELADALNTSLGRIKTYEGNIAVPPIEILVQLSDFMDISIDALIRIKLDESNYLMLKREKIKEKSFFDSLEGITNRLIGMERKVNKLTRVKG